MIQSSSHNRAFFIRRLTIRSTTDSTATSHNIRARAITSGCLVSSKSNPAGGGGRFVGSKRKFGEGPCAVEFVDMIPIRTGVPV